MYNAKIVEAKKKQEEKIKCLENMLRENAPSSKVQSTEKGLEVDRTGNIHSTTEKQLDKMRTGTKDSVVEKLLDSEKPTFGKSHRSGDVAAPKVHPLDSDRKSPDKYKPANGKK